MLGFFSSIYIKKMAQFSLIAIFFIVLDRLFKILAKLIWSNNPVKISSWFHLNYLPNSSLAFSLPANKYFILTAIILLIFILIVVYIKKLQEQSLEAFWWLLIVLGAVSNLLDRLFYGAVVDYLEISWFTAFNLADCLITIGVFALFIKEIRTPK